MIKAVIFDLDGTLLDRDSSLESFIVNQYHRFINYFPHTSQEDYVRRFIQLDSYGKVWKDVVYQNLVEEFKIERISWQDLLDDYETQFADHCIPALYLAETLTKLKQDNYRLGIITNGRTVFQSRAIQGLNIQDYFDTILISEAEKTRKPESEIFFRAFSLLNVAAKECVYIGDNPLADVVGAKNAGCKAIWRRNQIWSLNEEADAIIDELDEIMPILEQWNH